MKIDINNYEAFLLDFQEGNLDEMQTLQLKCFMDGHPELGDFDELTNDMPMLEAEQITFKGKKALLKPEIIKVGTIDENNYTEQFIAYHEGLLNSSEQQAIEAFLKKNPSLIKDFKLFGLAKIKPNTKVVFENKAALYRKIITFPIFAKIASVAATAALFVSLGFYFYQNVEPAQNVLALTTSLAPIAGNEIVTSETPTIVEESNWSNMVEEKSSNPTRKVKKQNTEIRQRQNSEPLASLDKKDLDKAKLSDEAEFYLGTSPERTFYIINNDYIIANANQKPNYTFPEPKDENLLATIVNKAVKIVSKGEYDTPQDVLKENLSTRPKEMIHNVAKASISTFYSLTENNIIIDKIESTGMGLRKGK